MWKVKYFEHTGCPETEDWYECASIQKVITIFGWNFAVLGYSALSQVVCHTCLESKEHSRRLEVYTLQESLVCEWLLMQQEEAVFG